MSEKQQNQTEEQTNTPSENHEHEHNHEDGCCDHDHSQKHDPIQNVAAEFTEQHFSKIWDQHKIKLEELSKKELGEQMFFSGAAMILSAVQQDHKTMVEQQQKETEERSDSAESTPVTESKKK